VRWWWKIWPWHRGREEGGGEAEDERAGYRLAEERWKTTFGWLQHRRLEEESTPNYTSRRREGGFLLELKKPNLFAWSTSRLHRYRDFVLETRFQPDGGNGHSAAGCVFRYINEENFYYFLVSTRAAFRLDVVFNGNPIHLIDWTACPHLATEEIDLRIIAHGSHLSFYCAEEWLAEIEDETIAAGTFGLAAQNFDEGERAAFRFSSLLVDSRPLEVEKAYQRWAHYLPADPACRLALGRTLFAMGQCGPAAVQLRKALHQAAGTADDHFLLAECLLRLERYEEALPALEQALRLEPGKPEAVLEKANLLYLMDRTAEACAYARSIQPVFPQNALLANLLGNCEYALGRWEPALDAYRQAGRLDPESGFYALHEARSLERLNRPADALQTYLRAVRLFFRREEYGELGPILARLKKLDPENPQAMACEGEVLFHEGRQEEAGRIFARLIEAGSTDSAVHFLYGLVLAARGDRRAADGHLRRACELEPDYHLYWLRRAENLHLLGADGGKKAARSTEVWEALDRACRLAPEDPWVNNMAGMLHLEENRLEQAGPYLEKAWGTAPAEAGILINYTEYLDRRGETPRALDLLAQAIEAAAPPGPRPPGRPASGARRPSAIPPGGDLRLGSAGTTASPPAGTCGLPAAALANHRANLLARAGRYAEALADYERAVRLEPGHPQYLENCAACCIELDMVMRAEELLAGLLDRSPSPSVYNKVGNLAFLQRDYRRAELAYQEGLALQPRDPALQLNLAALHLERGDYPKAKEGVSRLLEQEPQHAGALALLARLRGGYETRFACAGCGREWWAPREVPPQPSIRIHGEPPGEAPAGECEECRRLYCVRCACEHLRDQRFVCPHCDRFLRLGDERLKYLLLSYLDEELKKR
jgi:tetratricopeptide (TPR) repeat protein